MALSPVAAASCSTGLRCRGPIVPRPAPAVVAVPLRRPLGTTLGGEIPATETMLRPVLGAVTAVAGIFGVERQRRQGSMRRCHLTSRSVACRALPPAHKVSEPLVEEDARDRDAGAAASLPRRALATLPAVAAAAAGSRASAEGLQSIGDENFRMDLPGGFTWNNYGFILVKTHQYEQRVNANDPYGKFVIGCSVDKVKVKSVEEGRPPEAMAENMAEVERSKDGHIQTEVLAARREPVNGVPMDTYEYRSESQRGYNHFLIRVAIASGYLVNITIQAPEELWGEVGEKAQQALSSLRTL